MSKRFRDFFSRSKSSHDNSKSSIEDTIILQRKQIEELQERLSLENLPSFAEWSILQRKQIEELQERLSLENLPSWNELIAYVMRNINKSVVDARNMEIITGYSADLRAPISDAYDNVIQAILATPGDDLETDKMAVRLLNPFDKVLTQDTGLVKKKPHELTCNKIIARSLIGIDGNVFMLLQQPDGTGQTERIDPELLALHRSNVDISVQNWKYILDTIVKVIGLLSIFMPTSPRP